MATAQTLSLDIPEEPLKFRSVGLGLQEAGFALGGGGKMAREVLLDEEGGDGRCRVGTKTAMLDIDADGDGRIVHGGESDEGGMVAARGLGRAGLATEGVGGGLHARQRTVEDGLAHAPDDGGIGGRGGLGEMDKVDAGGCAAGWRDRIVCRPQTYLLASGQR